MNMPPPYPDAPAQRAQWSRSLRKKIERPSEASKPAILLETEPDQYGRAIQTATIFLINRECPWTCVMCDLWQHTTVKPLPRGHVPHQIKQAIAQLKSKAVEPIRHIKLYNSGSFFDVGAIPLEDYASVASLLDKFDRVIVECHPKLIGTHTLEFANMLRPKLEIAMGLETASDDILQRLNKRFTLSDYQQACVFLGKHSIDHRAFVMIQPPFVHPNQTQEFCLKSVQIAFECGAACVAIIPTRNTTEAMETLRQTGNLHPLSLEQVESCLDAALNLKLGRVWLDLWDLEHLQTCPTCFEGRKNRIETMNATQSILPKTTCTTCQPG
jgi:radical SAM enzyme (TIGR01210 family)